MPAHPTPVHPHGVATARHGLGHGGTPAPHLDRRHVGDPLGHAEPIHTF